MLGDSILKDLPPSSIDAIKKKFGLDYLRFWSFGGYTTQDLIGKSGMVERLMDLDPNCDTLLLCSRSNDGRTHPTGTVQTRTSKLYEDYVNLIADLKRRHPRLRTYALPQPRRFVSKFFSEKHPENSNPEFIAEQNDIISLFQDKMLASQEMPDFHFMPSLSERRLWQMTVCILLLLER